MEGLSKSASAPGLRASEQGASLRAGANAGLGTTSLYDKMRAEGKFREQWPNVKPAGRSLVTPADDVPVDEPPTPTALRKYRRTCLGPGEMNVHWGLKDQKLPAEDHRYGMPGVTGISTESTMKAGLKVGVAEYQNSVGERVYASNKRKPLGTAFSRGHAIHIPEKGFGKKDYDVADEENVPGMPARCPFPKELAPESDQDKVVFSFVLGGVDSAQLVANEKLLRKLEVQVTSAVVAQFGELRMGSKCVFLQPSHGPDGVAMKVQIDPPDNVSVESVFGKFADLTGLGDAVCKGASGIYGMDKISTGPLTVSSTGAPEVVRGTATMYKLSHKTLKPGEQVQRKYEYPKEVHQPNFRFGGDKASAVSGAGARLALNMQLEEDGAVVKTRVAKKVCEDYRNVKHPKPFQRQHYMQGPDGPPVPKDHVFGVKSVAGEITAEACIKGGYSLQEQLPDQDLGRCTKPGRRNVTTEVRAFGVPSIRTDVPAPKSGGRSVADLVSYGDECGAAALLGPQRFDERGVADSEFLIRRNKQELASLVGGLPDIDLEALWPSCMALFDDGQELVSLDALLFMHSQSIDHQVNQRVGAFSRPLARSASVA